MDPADTPLIFIHYGRSSYLASTLACARTSNPEKRIIFLGDASNTAASYGLAEHRLFDSYLRSEQVEAFNFRFTCIQGTRHKFNKLGGTQVWLKFVFQRWFAICEFLVRENIKQFWTFDSDTLILAPLVFREERFAPYDTTTQCRDCCLNGFVGSRQLVERYTSCMIDLFSDEAYLAAQRKRLEKQAGLAFNEMDAFCEFRRRNKVKTFHAAQPLHGEFFDDALAYDAAYEASPHKIRNNITVKRVWRDGYGALYARHLASREFVRMVTCNLSWLPDYVGKKLTRFCLTPEEDEKVTKPSKSDLLEVDFSQPLADRVRSVLRAKLDVLRGLVGRNSAGAPGTVAQKR